MIQADSMEFVAQAQKLKALAERLEVVLQQQARRFDDAFVPGGDVPHDPKSLKQLMTEFERDRLRWEQQQEQELERIRHDSALLTDAWLKLEAEQRRLLAERQALQVGATNFALPRSVLAVCSGDAAPCAAPTSATELSVLEFQQLKREMSRQRKP
jgi:hypothetical protein